MSCSRRRTSGQERRALEIAILGAGCAGSSLAYLLVREGFPGTIHLLDRRTDFSREQRWCSWGPIPECLSGLVGASWPRWKVASGQEEALCSLPERPYLHVYAPDFYRRVHAELAHHPSVRLHLGTGARSVEEHKKRALIDTAKGTLAVDLAFDSRPPAAGRDPSEPEPHVRLRQSFVGRVVRTDGAAFDERTATLMDFGFEPSADVSFVYVLPFRPDRALVESTVFSRKAVPGDEHRRRVDRYLTNRGISGYSVESEESGDIAMTTEVFPGRVGDRHFLIGSAGGATRPSSGYAFVPILRQSQRIARSLIRGGAPPSGAIPRKYRFFDAIFLDAVDRSAALARESFVRMFDRVPPAALVRFLSNESGLRDDLRLISALPKTPFVRAAVRRAAALGQL
jgi:lycopene beta-cyclase